MTAIGVRIWARDAALWTGDPEAAKEVAERLGWLDLPESMRPHLDDLRDFAGRVRADGIDRVLVCGMGGSSLCVEVLARVLGPGSVGVPSEPGPPGPSARDRRRAAGLPVRVLDSTHPAAVAAADEWAVPERTLYVIASKSGTTTEPNDFAAFFEARAAEALGPAAGGHLVAITDPGTVLVEHAEAFGYRRAFPNPPDVGGRYSALSLFGLVPAALLGVDLDALLERARELALECGPDVADEDNPGVELGRFMAEHALAGRDKVTVLTVPELAVFGLWVEQLLAESTGKHGKGLLPVVNEAPGPPEAFGEDRAVVAIDYAGVSAPGASQLKALERPVMFLGLGEGVELGAEFLRWEFATAVAGHLLGVNAFDQPDVQAAKDATKRVLAELARGGELPAPPVWLRDERDVGAVAAVLRELLAGAGPGQYVALQAYLDPAPPVETALEAVRTRIRGATRAATTVGFGPRFLHSTGQYHKGGPNTGRFIQLVDRPARDLDVPGRGYSFGTLVAAQAAGDAEALEAKGRHVVRIGVDGPSSLDLLAEAVTVALGDAGPVR
ncbi:MAG TPA: glucose-6-phosphate isomerase [Actinomycetes bacterium]|jgi:glucose-6-phosphate isomerase|nr:glucose-6-phosphate isomerase [Actinomycetes bacterium]